jgi:hypothetical protein
MTTRREAVTPDRPEASSPSPRRLTRADSAAVSIPTRPWPQVIKRVSGLWKPEFSPHHSVLGQNGAGKSHLIVFGLLPLCKFDNVLLIDNKGDDPVLNASGARPVTRIPPRWRRALDNKDEYDGWFRLKVFDEVPRAQDQVGRALEMVYGEGEWIIVLDETRAISDPRSPGLGLQPLLDRMWLRGRSRKICVVASTQAPRWVPTSFYDQCQFVWSSRIRDDRAHQRIMEIGSMTRAHIPHIAAVRKRRWIYMDDEEEETWMAETGL